MTDVKKTKTADGFLVEINGAVDDLIDLPSLIGPVQGTLLLNTRGVSRFNSAGTRLWMSYFEGLKKKGIKTRFAECSPTVVQQMNLFWSFKGDSEVISFYLPYICERCLTPVERLITTAEAMKKDFELPIVSCPKCGSRAKFDDIVEEYFKFLRKSP